MEFPDEAYEDSFYELDTVILLLCGIFENHAFEVGMSIALIDIDYEQDFVVLFAKGADKKLGEDLCYKINKRFIAAKGRKVCIQDQGDPEIFYILMKSPMDLDYKKHCLDS